MNSLMLLSAFIFLSSLLPQGDAHAVELRSAKALSLNFQGSRFIATLQPGYHFNEQAPNQLEISGKKLKPSWIEKLKIEFSLEKIPAGQGKASLYVCDDANTYCETHRLPVHWEGSSKDSLKTGENEKSPQHAKSNHASTQSSVLKLAETLKKAQQDRKLVLVAFEARWCPGCMRMEKEIYPSKEYSQLTRDFLKITVDVDLTENFPLTAQYSIEGIPALLAINPDGQEIARIVDYQPLSTLRQFVSQVQTERRPLIDAQKNHARHSSKQALILGRRFLTAQQYSQAVDFLSQVQPVPPELIAAQLGEAAKKYQEKSFSKKDYQALLQKALTQESQSTRSILWRAKLISLLDSKSEETRKLLSECQTLVEGWMKNAPALLKATKTDEVGEFKGYEKMLVASYWADALENASLDPTPALQLAAEQGAKYQIPVRLYGPSLRYLIFLVAAKKYKEADEWSLQILKAHPEAHDVQRRRIKILLSLNKNAEAIATGEKYVQSTEGRTQFWAAQTLAKAYLADQRKAEANTLLKQYLARPEIQEKPLASVKQEMESLLKQSI